MKKLSPKDKTIHDQFSVYGKNAKEWMNKCVLLLPQIEKNQIWAKKGFSNIYDYARKIAGMSRNKVNESLRILGKAEHLPAIMEVIERKGIFAVKPIVNIATKETEQFWAKRASEMRKSTLETFIRDYRKEHEGKIKESSASQHIANSNVDAHGRPGAGSPMINGLDKPNLFQSSTEFSCKNIQQDDENPDFRVQVSMKLESETIDALRQIKGDDDWNFIMKKLLKSYQKEIEIEQKQHEAEEKPQAVKSKNHTVTTAIKNYILKRSKSMCEHPNCKKPGKHIHHIEPFALKKVHDPDKLVHLCSEHHQIIHLGYIDDSTSENIKPAKRTTILWKQVEKLPAYDIKNVINQRIAEYKH